MKSKTVRAWGFVILELVQGSENFFFLYGSVKGVFIGLGNLRGDMLKKEIREMILVFARGCIEGVEVGGGVLLNLVEVLKDFPFLGFKLGDLIGPVSDFGLVVEEGGVLVTCLQPEASRFKPPSHFFFR
jgi:hypothetical protein